MVNNGLQLSETQLWKEFIHDQQLNATQSKQFEQYFHLLDEWNKKTNITRITSQEDVIQYHFQDSFLIGRYIDIPSKKGIADVGSGGGFPGIPLKIKYPEVPIVLIEVNAKKVSFLETVIQELGLENIHVSTLDWRTFLRKAEYDLDLFCSRASLHPDELIRIFSPTCRYRHAILIYWASTNWQPEALEKPFLQAQEKYVVGDKERNYVFFALPEVIEQV